MPFQFFKTINCTISLTLDPCMQVKLNIVHVIDQLNIGGTENVLVTLCNILSRHGHNVSVVTTVTEGPLVTALDKGINVINIARKSKWHLPSMRRLVTVVKQFDVIHVHSSYNLRYLFVAAKLFRLKKPVFFHEHFGDIEIDASVAWHHRFIYPKTVMICVSRKIYEWAGKNLQMPKGSLFVLPNIVLKKPGLPARKPVGNVLEILVVSNIRPTKNIEFAVELLSKLKQVRPCRLTIIGQKAGEEYYHKITLLIAELGVDNDITMLHNISDIQPLLHKFDIALHTAKSESGPLVLIEYLAQNLPFVTYNTGETVLQIRDALPGCIAHTFNANEWMERVDSLLTTPADVLTKKLADVYEAKFSEEAYYNNCLDIYTAGLGL